MPRKNRKARTPQQRPRRYYRPGRGRMQAIEGAAAAEAPPAERPTREFDPESAADARPGGGAPLPQDRR